MATVPQQIPRVPRPQEPTNEERLRHALDLTSAILNSLLLSGQIRQTGPASYTIVGSSLTDVRANSGNAPAGRPGRDANAWLLSLTDPPASALGVLGDFAFAPSSGNVYQKQSPFFGYPPSWVLLGNLKGGPIGPAGPLGPVGPPGPPGRTGAVGPTGLTGQDSANPVISAVVLGSNQTTISFSSIPATFTHLALRLIGRSTTAATTAQIKMTFNTDTAANYDQQLILESNNSVTGAQGTNSTEINVGDLAAASSPAGHCGAFDCTIYDYAGTSFFKVAVANGWRSKTTGGTNQTNERYTGHWRSTAAINRLDLNLSAGDWASGSKITLYGVP